MRKNVIAIITEALRQSFSLHGRMHRRLFGLRTILVIPASAIIAVFSLWVVLTVLGYENIEDMRIYRIILGAVTALGLVALVSASVRRLHDMNASGWWFCLFLLPGPNVIIYLVLLFFPPRQGAIQYGIDPFLEEEMEHLQELHKQLKTQELPDMTNISPELREFFEQQNKLNQQTKPHSE